MRYFLLLSLVLIFSSQLKAQSYAGYTENKKVQHAAAVLDLPFEEDLIVSALNAHLSRKSKSSNDLKGFTGYRNNLLDQGERRPDHYFKVERKSRKEKKSSLVFLLVGPVHPGVAGDGLVYMSMEEARSFLNSLVPVIEAYALEMNIKDQNDELKKAESRYASLIKDGEDLEKKKADIERKIQENANKVRMQIEIIENQKQKLAEQVNKRATN